MLFAERTDHCPQANIITPAQFGPLGKAALRVESISAYPVQLSGPLPYVGLRTLTVPVPHRGVCILSITYTTSHTLINSKTPDDGQSPRRK
jgi:hypothetical protein